ncbi:hypothetical protein VTL71DRAFT_10903 [Oculimacula yallundae]|uniref:Uncharacterized protein n=1 Tax=Oculimacula yallundae TaxID=86028 RepID=A0ABR4CVG8_9HELO
MSQSPPAPEEDESTHHLALQKWLNQTTSTLVPSNSLDLPLQSKGDEMARRRVSFDGISDRTTEYPSNGYLNPALRRNYLPTPSDGYEDQSPSNHLFFTNDQGFVQNPFVEDIDRRFPRVPIGPSMLSTYSFMRAKNTAVNDPLHSALFTHPSRNFYDQRPMRLELVSRRHSIDSLPKRTTFFWDPLKEQPRIEIPYVPFDPFRPPPANTSFDEHIRQFPPSIGTNHYKGDEVWSNFGYVKIRGRWIDPDSEGEVADAFKAEDYGNDDAPYLPDLQKSPDTGPRIMTPEEEMQFYSAYTEDVSDEIDGEGDPRFYRISPATFARWAAGGGSGERYEEDPFVPGPKLPFADPEDEVEITPIPRPSFQYDMETGSVLSGLYEAEPNPQVLRHAQGVNIVRPPAVFAYSYPQTAIDLDNQAFSNGQLYGPASSIASTPEVFNSVSPPHKPDILIKLIKPQENGIRNIAPKLGDVQTGVMIYEDTRQKVDALRNEIQLGGLQLFNTADAAKDVAEQRTQLGREVFFLQDRLASMPPLPPPSSIATATPTTTHDHLSHHQVDGPTSPASPSPRPQLRRRTQYQRYMREELSRSETAATKTREFTKKLEIEHQEILDDIEKLRIEKEELLAQLGVSSLSDLPGLIPVRVEDGSERELRAQFGLEDDLE